MVMHGKTCIRGTFSERFFKESFFQPFLHDKNDPLEIIFLVQTQHFAKH